MDLKKISGYKTYIVGGALILYAVCGLIAGKIDVNLAVAEVLTGFGMLGLRHGIAKAEIEAEKK